MDIRKPSRGLLLASATALVVAACGGTTPTNAPTNAPTGDATAAPTGDATAAPTGGDATAEPSGENSKSFVVAFTSIGLSSVPFLAAIDDLNSQGYTITTQELADNSLIVAGVTNNQFQYSSGTTSAALLAIQQGSGIKLIGDRVANEWTIVSQADIEECADLDGKRLAQHAEGAVSTAMVRGWLAENCPEATPNELIMAGSDNRANALVADQIDASPLELSDATSLLAADPDKFRLLTSFAETLPDLRPSTVYGNVEFMEANPETTEALLGALLAQHQRIADEPDYLKTIAIEYIPSINQETLDAVAGQYRDLGLFPVDGGLTEANLQYSITFFEESGFLEPGLTLDQAADLSYLEAAKAQ